MKLHYALLAGIALSLASGNSTQAGPMFPLGTVTMIDHGAPTVSPGTDINFATVFNVPMLVTNTPGTGTLALLPETTFAAAKIDLSNAASFTLTDPGFGTFQSTSIKEIANVPGTVTFFIVGSYAPGTVPGGLPTDAFLTISFTQTPSGPSGAISDSASFAYPVPEPQSLSLIGIGLASVSFFRKLRKRMGK